MIRQMNRRQWARCSALGVLGFSCSGWLPALSAWASANQVVPKKKCILLWMSGGPSQLETFDPKSGHENGGPTGSIETSVPGIRFAEHLPQLAKVAEHMAVIRSMSTKEGDHSRATYFNHTGYLPQGPLRYPTMGSFLGRELKDAGCDLPAFVSVNPFRAFSPAAFGPGFLGPSWSPLVVESQTGGQGTDQQLSFEVSNLRPASDIASERSARRLQLLTGFEHDFLAQRPGTPGRSHQEAYQQAVRMMKSSAVKAFDLDGEDAMLRDAYGRNPFGQGCLLARRLIENGVSFVEVTLSGADGTGGGAGWDTHQDNFSAVGSLCQVLDPAWSTLINDLQQRGLLQDTLVVWMGEFGRTPKINENTGRDHWPKCWSTALCGAGIRGGQVLGATSADGMEVIDHAVGVPDLIATVCAALGLDHQSTNPSNIGRPIPLADHGAAPIEQLLTSG
ncbi:MAG: DUF1501 domain-containing protein [Planctomycetaceae bacterium]|nr:DUF1501 domain-containing protein [Planctomycetaceae bacterium]